MQNIANMYVTYANKKYVLEILGKINSIQAHTHPLKPKKKKENTNPKAFLSDTVFQNAIVKKKPTINHFVSTSKNKSLLH